jgi:hypothetical protein
VPHLVRARWRFQRALRRWRAGQLATALRDGDRAVTMFAALAIRRPGRGPDELVCALLAVAGSRTELADHAAAEQLCQRALAALDTGRQRPQRPSGAANPMRRCAASPKRCGSARPYSARHTRRSRSS